MILHIEVESDISSDTSGPALPNVGLSNLYYGKRSDGLSHSGPATKHHSTVLRLPVKRDRQQKVRQVLWAVVRTENQLDLGQHMAPLLIYLLQQEQQASCYII